MILFYDKQGEPMSQLDWSKAVKKDRNISYTVLSGGRWVSTIWLGLNHRFGPGRPLIFETMVFPSGRSKTPYNNLDMRRYSTLKEARAGHKAMVKKWSTKGKRG